VPCYVNFLNITPPPPHTHTHLYVRLWISEHLDGRKMLLLPQFSQILQKIIKQKIK